MNRALHRLGQRAAERVGWLWLLLTNAAIITVTYALNASSLLQVVKPQPTAEDHLLVALYVLSVALAVALLAFAVLTAFPTGRVASAAALLCATVAVVAVIVDIKLFALMGLHLYDPLVLTNLQNRHIDAELNLGLKTMLTVIGFIGFAGAAQVLLWRWCRRRVPATRIVRSRSVGSAMFTALAMWAPCVMLTVYLLTPAQRHGNPVLGVLPAYEPLFARARAQLPLALRYPDLPEPTPTLQQRPDILIMMAESFRADMLTPELTPRLFAFDHGHGTVRSQHHDAGCHTTEFAVFSTLYGLDALHYSPCLQGRTQSLPLRLLAANGYTLIGATAAAMGEWNYAEFLFDVFDEYREFHEHGDHRDDFSMQQWLAQRLRARNPQQPLLIFAFFNATHHNYHYPPEFERFTPVLPDDHNYFMETNRLADSREHILNRYKNSVGYVDHLAGELLTVFGQQASDDAVVLFTSDHGEEFWEHDLLGHSATRFVNPRTQVPLVLSLPGSPSRTVRLSSHADIMPTLMDHLDVDDALSASSYANGSSLLAPLPPDRHITIYGSGFPFGNDLMCVMTARHKHWLKKRDCRLRDVERVLISDATDNLVDEDPRGPEPPCIEQARLNMYRFLDEGY